MKLSLKKPVIRIEAPRRSAEEVPFFKDHDPSYSENFNSDLYFPDNGKNSFCVDLQGKVNPHIRKCNRTIKPNRMCFRHNGLTVTIPFEGEQISPRIERQFDSLFEEFKGLEKKYGVHFAGIVHGDVNIPVPKNTPKPTEVAVTKKPFKSKYKK